MDDFLACAEVCEGHGFTDQAARLRGLVEGRERVFVVSKSLYVEIDLGPEKLDLFLHREDAEARARIRNREALSNSRILQWVYDYSQLSELTQGELERRMETVLGHPVRLPELGTSGRKVLIPPDATDAYANALLDLLHPWPYVANEIPLHP